MCDLLSVNSPSNSPINARKAGLFKLETLKDFHLLLPHRTSITSTQTPELVWKNCIGSFITVIT